MQLIETAAGFRKALDAERAVGRTVGLVPTMGYLHDGHASLVRRAAAECDVAAATIFVNPLQFGPGEDYEAYPRDLERDSALAQHAGATHLFAPPVDEMFREATRTSVHVGGAVTERLEGASRPGHFDGVATIVAKLFNLAGTCRAYFGEKDWQQLCVVRRMTADLSFAVDVIGCATVRDADGLAMSSRNAYLSSTERAAATVLYRALTRGRGLVDGGERNADAVRAAMANVIAAEPLAALDYVEVAAASTLEPLTTVVGDVRLLVAARVGPARLIDNLGVTV